MILLVNGSPFALIVPYFSMRTFKAWTTIPKKRIFFYDSCAEVCGVFDCSHASRLVCICGKFYAGILPSALLYKTAAAESATPLPLFAEAIFVNFLLEIVREAGLRLPRAIGHSVSLVAALILGDAAVSAGLWEPLLWLSPP